MIAYVIFETLCNGDAVQTSGFCSRTVTWSVFLYLQSSESAFFLLPFLSVYLCETL